MMKLWRWWCSHVPEMAVGFFGALVGILVHVYFFSPSQLAGIETHYIFGFLCALVANIVWTIYKNQK